MAFDAVFTPSDSSGARNIMVFDWNGEFATEFIYRETEPTGLLGNHRIYLTQKYVEEQVKIVVTAAVWPTIISARNLKGTLQIGQGSITNVRLLNAHRIRGLNQSAHVVTTTVRTPTFDYIEMMTTWVKEAN